ncbi:MAG: hypothetical protein HY020_21200 [Burkholderiales bacterium]|nr:hypothetical protein [Burkholderiales bacterium]
MPLALPIAALLLLLGANAVAQPRPDPLNARAPVPPVVHKPVLPRPADDPPPADWRAANEHVSRVGGWRTYAREKLPEAPR